MNPSISRFTLDLQKSQSQISIPVTQGDTSREFHINLTDGGKPYEIATGVLAMFTMKRETGTEFNGTCSIVDNTTIVFKFSDAPPLVGVASVAGVHVAEIRLIGGMPPNYDILASAKFFLVVHDRVVDGEVADEDYTIIDEFAANEAIRMSQEAQRVSAEGERNKAEEERRAAETERQQAFSALSEVIRPLTAADNGKFLRAENGVAVWQTIDIAEEVAL